MREKKLLSHYALGLLKLSFAIVPTGFAAAPAVMYEPPPTLAAKDMLPTALLQSEYYRVLDDVRYRGYLLEFELETDRATEVVISVPLLKIRMHEATVLAEAAGISIQESARVEPDPSVRAGTLDYGTAAPFDAPGDSVGETNQLRFPIKQKPRPRGPEDAASESRCRPPRSDSARRSKPSES